MSQERTKTYKPASKKYLLAMHSSSETFGVATLDYCDPKGTLKSSTFEIGRRLSNNILSCVEEILPLAKWKHICRLAVATGPGGFTGTRLSISMARIIAQQLNCPLDGVSSFALMAPRLSKYLTKKELNQPFWITKKLERRGIIAGKYFIENCSNKLLDKEVIELKSPYLLNERSRAKPSVEASEDVLSDVVRLLNISACAHELGKSSPWKEILPIYPTSPVDNLK